MEFNIYLAPDPSFGNYPRLGTPRLVLTRPSDTDLCIGRMAVGSGCASICESQSTDVRTWAPFLHPRGPRELSYFCLSPDVCIIGLSPLNLHQSISLLFDLEVLSWNFTS